MQNKFTPLITASRMGATEIVDLLLKYGAKPDVPGLDVSCI